MNVIKFASRLNGARVDFEKRIIYDVNVMTEGRAFGHGQTVDQKTLAQFKTQVDGSKLRGREDHPGETPTGKPEIAKKVGDLRGYFFNFRVVDEKLLADFQALSEEAGGKETTRLLYKAHEAPEIFGVSPVFFGKPENGMARVSKVVAIDFVDIPAGDDANQQLFKGEQSMDPLKAEEREGKFYIKCEAEMQPGEYEVTFPPKKDDEAAKLAAEETAKKEEAAKLAAEEEAKKKEDAAKLAAQAPTAADLEKAREEGRASAIKYAADFDGVMDAAGLKGQARDDFRAKHFAKGEKFGIDYVKELAGEIVKLRAKAVGEGGGDGHDAKAEEAVQRFSASAGVRTLWGCNTSDKTSKEWKDAEAAYVAAQK